MKLESIDVRRLDVPARPADLRRDIHVFVDYVRNRDVKRSHRENALSKADARRLAKLLSDPEAVEEVESIDRIIPISGCFQGSSNIRLQEEVAALLGRFNILLTQVDTYGLPSEMESD